ncbi:MAG: amidohydrolase family protein [Candidatus Solibacter sp.]
MRGYPGIRRGHDLREINVIPDGAILVRGGILTEVGPSRRVENLAEARGAIEINAAGRVVMPGFVDAHTHLASPPPGIHVSEGESAVRALHAFTGHRLEARARICLAAMVRHGTTTVEVKTAGGLDEGSESKLLRVLHSLLGDPIDLVPTFFFRLPAGNVDEGLPLTEQMAADLLPKIARRGVVRFADVAWEPDPAMLPCLERYLEAAGQLGFHRKIHAAGPNARAAIDLAIRHKVASIDHLEHLEPGDVCRIGEAGLTVVLVPSGLLTETRTAPVRRLIEAGAGVALGSNFNLSHSPMLSMQTVTALACGRMAMTLEESLTAATINSAYALGCGDTVGSLEPGKVADLLILNAGHYLDLGQSLGTNLVHMTMKRGRVIYREADVAPIPAEELAPGF